MKRHKWWLALVLTLATPWIGAHVDTYVPLGWVVVRALKESPDIAFWIFAAVVLLVAYFVWVGILAGAGMLWARTRRV